MKYIAGFFVTILAAIFCIVWYVFLVPKDVPEHREAIRRICISEANGVIAFSKHYPFPNEKSSDPSAINIASIASGKLLKQLKAHDAAIQGVDIARDGRTMVSATVCEISVWDTKKWKRISNMPVHDTLLMNVILSPDGRKVIYAGPRRNGSVVTVCRARDLKVELQKEIDFTVEDLLFSNDGRSLLIYGSDPSIHIFDPEKMTTTRKLKARQSNNCVGFIDICLSRNGVLVSLSASGDIEFWDINKQNTHPTYKPFVELAATDICLSPNGALLAVRIQRHRGSKGMIKLWHLPSGKFVKSIELDKGLIPPMCKFVEDHQLITGAVSKDGLPVVITLRPGKGRDAN